MFSKLRFILSHQDQHYIYGMLLLSLLVSLIELIGISAIAPFIAVASDFSLIESKTYFAFVYHFLHFDSPVAKNIQEYATAAHCYEADYTHPVS